MTILVTGATGLIGSALVEALVDAGEPTAALSRSPAEAAFGARVEVRAGNIADPDDLAAVLDDVDRLFLFPMAAPRLVDLARTAGVEHVVLLSSMNAAVDEMPDPLHKPMEAALEASGMGWTHLRPGEFAHNKARLWGESVKRDRTVHWPDRPGLASAPIHERDVADVAVAALRDPDRHRGRSYVLTGPEKLSVRKQVRDIATALDESVGFHPVTVDHALADLQAGGGWGAAARRAVLHLDAPDAPAISDVPALRDSTPAGTAAGDEWVLHPRYAWMLEAAPDYETVVGRPGRSFARWARDHVDDFR